jgi:hypothetical protein
MNCTYKILRALLVVLFYFPWAYANDQDQPERFVGDHHTVNDSSTDNDSSIENVCKRNAWVKDHCTKNPEFKSCLHDYNYDSTFIGVCGNVGTTSINQSALKSPGTEKILNVPVDTGPTPNKGSATAKPAAIDTTQAASGAQPASVAKTPAASVTKPAATNISSGNAPSDATQDLSSCQTASSSASSACDVNQNPPATTTPTQTSNAQDTSNQDQSMSALCGQMRSASTSDASAWSDLVQTCVTKKKICTDTCGAALTKWQAQQNTCGDNCDSIPNTISQLTSNNDTCIRLAQNAQTLADNMNNAVNNSGQSAACQQQASGGASPASASNQNQQDQQNQQNNNTTQSASEDSAVNCNNPVNANSAKCKGDATTASAQDSSNDLNNAALSTPASAAGFNTADASSLRQNQGMLFPPLDGKMKTASADAPPGNSGGMTGGQGGGSGYPPPSRANAGGGQPGNSKAADVLKSDPRGGNGYTQGNSKAARGLASEDNGKRARTASDDLNNMKGLDLKDYLPGGAKDPTLRFVGLSLAHPDISPQRENIFERVSTRFMIHCKLQLLFDCH